MINKCIWNSLDVEKLPQLGAFDL